MPKPFFFVLLGFAVSNGIAAAQGGSLMVANLIAGMLCAFAAGLYFSKGA